MSRITGQTLLFALGWILTLSMAMGQVASSDQPDFHRLQAGDTVQIMVFNEPDLSTAQKLDPEGVVIVPLLGRTPLAGLTLREAETRLEELFISEEYLIHPQVTVTISTYADKVFYIFGEVNQPGAKTFPPGKQSLDILEAITMGGDLSQYAKRSEIIIRRPVKDEDREEKITVDLESILRGNKANSIDLLKIYPDDIIFVPERLF
ncbi:MAG: polysaccharide biosynthesis/export family protein [Opitutales bacterium]|jgi:polysaccharide export outer membrane protein